MEVNLIEGGCWSVVWLLLVMLWSIRRLYDRCSDLGLVLERRLVG